MSALARIRAEETDISRMVAEQADRLFSREAGRDGPAAVRLWREVEAIGLTLAMVAESAGGAGLSASGAAGLLRRCGYHAVPAPLPETMLAAALWAEAGGEIPSGALTLAPCAASDRISIAGGKLSGPLRRLTWGGEAGHILVLAHDDEGVAHLALVARGVAQVAAGRNLAGEPRDTLAFDGAPVANMRPAPADLADRLLGLCALLRCQQMVGAMERCFDLVLPHVRQRTQFGRPLAQFQAVQQMLAVAAGHLAAASAAADGAAEACGGPEFDFAVAVAKARIGEAASVVAATAHQAFGAIGFTEEHALHRSTLRLWAWRDEFGGPAFWQKRLGEMVCRDGGGALWPRVVGQ